ncbi:MAG TPA: GSCFA domain-containing protein, partial [Eudoraea sp.]|nr:GSCFA domain-containing protein [Eudoraea sp.]
KDLLVANCHKVPQREFSKTLFSPEMISERLNNIVHAINAVNRDTKVIFTVSPVRHLKDGFIENQRSKAHLVTALHAIIQEEQIAYFPAYELMLDELRDYRFYGADMVHPNALAIAYIWERFASVWISEEAVPVMEEVAAIQKGLQHRPFYEHSEQHQKFLGSLREKMMYLQKEYPFMEF